MYVVLQILYEAGIGFECVSLEELRHVFGLFPDLDKRPSDITQSRVIYTPNFASHADHRTCLASFPGATLILDSIYPLERWHDLFAGHRELMLRVDPSTAQRRGHHDHVKTTGKQCKFGISADELERIPTLVANIGARVVGLHAHVGSGILQPDTWPETAKYMSTLLTKFPDVCVFNLGGGLGVPEHESTQSSLDTAAVNDALLDCAKQFPQVQLWMEPGRFLVAQAGVLLCTVTQTKEKAVRKATSESEGESASESKAHIYIGVNTGFNTLIRPILYDAYHQIVNLGRLDETGDTITADVVGNICESGDVLGRARVLPKDTQEGDLLLIATTGAYGRSMSSHYNMREPAPEHFLL
eukprot:TRINITY_DN15180_c0_g1_i3.p1 TRINITY_DN15180_c0_g1~~TRINITY_DN15180_c0_g1_i3.p1  ORF type:complete len:356 (+),score=56.74 TRINITY_DN15180_c0_g1_i3:132-1199(+)